MPIKLFKAKVYLYKMEEDEKFLRPEDVCRIFKTTPHTLRRWDREGALECVRTKGGHRRYKLTSVLSLQAKKEGKEYQKPEHVRRKICYARVSTSSQKKDLETQLEFFRDRYPDYECVSDVGSGLNFKRRRFLSILDSAIKGDLGEVVVTHKDRLCRFGFELVERVIKSHGGKVVVLYDETGSPEQELVKDLLAITTVFSARLYGLRSHSLKRKLRDSGKARSGLEHRQKIQDDSNEVLSE